MTQLDSAFQGRRQFSLLSLFELVTVCCVLGAMSPALGLGPAMCLMVVAISLHYRAGLCAMLSLAAAYFLVPEGWRDEQLLWMQQLILSCAAAGICAWYWLRLGRRQATQAWRAEVDSVEGFLHGL